MLLALARALALSLCLSLGEAFLCHHHQQQQQGSFVERTMMAGADSSSSNGGLRLRRSKRIRDALPRRSSSLGEESDVDHYDETSKRKRRRNLSSNKRFTFGLIADIQYAPIPDGYSYSGMPRYYRHSLDVARHAARHFEQEKVSLVVNLGDIVDGKCQAIEEHGGEPLSTDSSNPGHTAADDVMEALSDYKSGPILHAYGNHCLYNLDRPTLQSKLGIPFVKEPCGDLVGYSSHSHNGVRFVTLDSYDVAIMQRCEKNSQKRQEAVRLLRANNPNYHENENSPEGLVGVAKRYVAFNGGVGELQLQWLRTTLSEARNNHEKVIILSHQPIFPGSTSPVCLIWNYKEVLAVLRDFSDIVVCSFAGHAHKGGYKRDPVSGIHFRVFEAVLENPHPHKTYAMLDFYDDHIEVRGHGNCKSAVYEFDHQPIMEAPAPAS